MMSTVWECTISPIHMHVRYRICWSYVPVTLAEKYVRIATELRKIETT